MTRPQLLMIDELSLGLAPTIVGQLLDVVREIHRRGAAVGGGVGRASAAHHLAGAEGGAGVTCASGSGAAGSATGSGASSGSTASGRQKRGRKAAPVETPL